jgi:hypothetical protein
VGTTFEPRLDSAVLQADAAVLSVTLAAAAAWWLVTVPAARTQLARSKRSGEVRSVPGSISKSWHVWLNPMVAVLVSASS